MIKVIHLDCNEHIYNTEKKAWGDPILASDFMPSKPEYPAPCAGDKMVCPHCKKAIIKLVNNAGGDQIWAV